MFVFSFRQPLLTQEEMRAKWIKQQDISNDKISSLENEEGYIGVGDGKTEVVAKRTNHSIEKLYPESQPQLQNMQVKNSENESNNHKCCETIHYKPPPKNKTRVAKLPSYDVAALMTLESTTGFFDSHCHIDRLFKKERFHDTYADFMIKHKGSYPRSYNGCIAVFCDPFMFAKVGNLQIY